MAQNAFKYTHGDMHTNQHTRWYFVAHPRSHSVVHVGW